MECYISNIIVGMLQSRNQLENKGGTNDKISRLVLKEIKDKTDEARIAKTERKRGKERKEAERKEGKI